MNPVFGIDLGTTNSVIAHLINGRAIPIEIAGSPIVPSIVLYLADRVVVGREARNLELNHPEATLRSVKRKIGTEHRYDVRGRTLSPEQVSSEVLSFLKKGAEAKTGATVRDVVITVPAYFNDSQRRATLLAGELAGLNVLRLLNEPTSASLIYDQLDGGAAQEPEIVLIYDLGGGTFDVSVLEAFQGVREVRSTAGNTHLGGDDFDELLVRHFLSELQMRQGVDPREDLRAMARLRTIAEETKIRLSSEMEVQVREEFLTQSAGNAIHFDTTITRRQFEEMIRPLLKSTIDMAHRAIDDARLESQRLKKICLVGGSTRIPLVRNLLEEAFQAEVHEEVDPDLAVGLGAVIQAGLLSGAELERILVDVNAHTLGIRVVGHQHDYQADTFAPILRRNTVLPAERVEEFGTIVDNQNAYNLEVFQGEGTRVSQLSKVGEYHIKLVPRPAHSPVRIKFSYDLNGVVKVSVSQPGFSEERVVTFKVPDMMEQKATQDGILLAEPATPQNVLERKAREVMEQVSLEDRRVLQGLLDRYLATTGDERRAAEEAILDFFLTVDGDDDMLDDDDEEVI